MRHSRFLSQDGRTRAGRDLEEREMGVFNGIFPIQAGKEEDARAFAAELVGAQLAGYEAHHSRVGNTRETFTLQETPMGSFLLVWFEGDVQKAFADHATDDSDFETWFRGRVFDLTGVDLAAPPAGCRFHPRCPFVHDDCHSDPIPLIELGGGRAARCLYHELCAADARREPVIAVA